MKLTAYEVTSKDRAYSIVYVFELYTEETELEPT